MQFSLSIPEHASVIPSKGSTIKIGDPLFSISQKQLTSVNVTTELAIKNEEIFKYMLKAVGDVVAAGETIAQKKKLVGSKQIQSPISGILESVDHITGDIVISVSSGNDQLAAFFSGKITMIDSEKHLLSVELASAEPLSAKTVPKDFGGELYFFSDESLFYTANEKDIAGKVIVIADLKNHIAAKFETLGAAGFVYITGQDPTDVPDVALTKVDFDRLVNAKKKYILFSGVEKKAVVYENN